ncbi:MinD/ParA family ATP-binding protein [Actinokineospora cianjurensis]|uniref:MinD/ParA family ATP-binding protein n=1 Tax=Actinokineospora cianjurensis TaxID=585224 RepID=UPI0011C37340|nr:hypothetical protein [Actinokineospora cianjurensis]
MEARHRQAEAAARQPLGGPRLVMVAGLEGGAGVTTTTLMLAHAFASLRGGAVVAWDNRESHGTLGLRAEVGVPDTHVGHLLDAFDRLIGPTGTAGDLGHYLRSQPSRAEVLAANTDPARPAQIAAADAGRIGSVLSRYFPLAIAATGTNLYAEAWQWTAAAAGHLVVPIRLEPDVVQAAAFMLDALARRRPDLVAGAVTVVSPSSAPAPAPVRAQMLAYFATRTAIVVEVPADPQLAGGRQIAFARISEASRRAWTVAAAAVADRLAAVPARRPDQITALRPPPDPSGRARQQSADHGTPAAEEAGP